MEDAMEIEGEEVKLSGGGAESVLNLTADSSISLCYHSLFGSHDDVILLELDDKLLPHVLNNRVVVRGQPDDEAVLCTPSATYAMKFVGTSNSVFLIPPGEATPPSTNSEPSNGNTENSTVSSSVSSIIKVATGTIELSLVSPRIDKLKSLLSMRPYRLEEDMEVDLKCKDGLYTWKDLLKLIQASEQELQDGLKSLSAVEIDNYWRIVDTKTMDEVLNMVLHNAILHGWQLNALKEEEVVSVLEVDGFPKRIVTHCLDTFGSKSESLEGSLCALDEKLVCQHFALRVLAGGTMKVESFMEKWKKVIPFGMRADLKMLEGEVLYEKFGAENWIRTFSVSALPSTPAERFAALFRERPKWEWKDLEPFTRDLRIPGITYEGLLLKYTRRSQPSADVEPIFSAR